MSVMNRAIVYELTHLASLGPLCGDGKARLLVREIRTGPHPRRILVSGSCIGGWRIWLKRMISCLPLPFSAREGDSVNNDSKRPVSVDRWSVDQPAK